MSTDANEPKVSAGPSAGPPPVPPWVRRLALLAAIGIGWGFIAWHNHFYLTPPVVVLALGWSASVSTLYFLWRLGAAGADATAMREDWWLGTSKREELEREKRLLLKSIREIEFDHETGKLSQADANAMTQVVRARAIEVMKALDEVDAGGGVRAEIERELRARLEIEAARKTVKKGKAKGGKAGKPAKPAKPAARDSSSPRSETAINAHAPVDPAEGDALADDGERATDDGGDADGDAAASPRAAAAVVAAASPVTGADAARADGAEDDHESDESTDDESSAADAADAADAAAAPALGEAEVAAIAANPEAEASNPSTAKRSEVSV